MVIRYPEKLKKGDTIGITPFSMSVNLEKIDIAKEKLEKIGYNVIETDIVRNEEKYFIGADGKTRAEKFMSLWQNSDVKHIISARGGEFAIDMIPFLHEYKEVLNDKNIAKYVQGFSDTSLINFYLTTNYNIATLNSEHISDYWMKNLERPQTDTLNIISGNYENNEHVQHSFDKYQITEFENGNFEGYNLTEKVEYKLVGSKETSFSVEGRIIGGCIDVITQLLGTKFDNTKEFCSQFKEGMIWYIDNCELTFLELYRKLFQMKNAGWFDNINCILIGRNFGEKVINGFTIEMALEKALGDLHIPMIYDVDIGHVPPQFVMVNGSYGIFEYNNGKGILTQKFE